MHANRRAHRCEAWSSTRMEAVGAHFKREDTLGALAGHLVSDVHTAEEEYPIPTEMSLLDRQATSRDSIKCIVLVDIRRNDDFGHT